MHEHNEKRRRFVYMFNHTLCLVVKDY